MPTPYQRYLVNVNWLIKLRWVAVVGQLLTIGTSAVAFRIELNVWPLFVVIGLTIVSNAILMLWYSGRSAFEVPVSPSAWNAILALVMTLDMLSLTTLLYATGGPTNPFCLFFFVNLSLSAVVLDRAAAWMLNLLSVACYAWLLFNYVAIPELELGAALLPVSQRGSVSLAHAGLLVAFATCASVIVYFMTRLTGELREQEMSMRVAQQNQARSEKLEALGTLAAGAAHELATPLTTIALVAKDVEKAVQGQASSTAVDSEVIEDIALIRGELDRCKKILDRMSSHAGQSVGEMMQSVTVDNLWGEVMDGLTDSQNVVCDITSKTGRAELTAPVDALSQALRGLVQNALQAGDSSDPVQVRISQDSKFVRFTISDRGPGMTADVLMRISEPFFTTKQPGKGMGLGVFLAKNVVERLGGRLEFESALGQGTIATVKLPIHDSPAN